MLAGDRNVLGQAITLVESNAQAHFDMGQEVLRQLLPHTGNSIRVGITGVPGAGKSTFIEALGLHLCAQGHKVAVLAVDPSSTVTRGSILGDKTRMELLSRDLRAFIRPSPSGGTLGCVARKSRETILVCEAAGFDVILVETVGVGQSETTVRSMVDFFLLLMGSAFVFSLVLFLEEGAAPTNGRRVVLLWFVVELPRSKLLHRIRFA